MSAVSVSAGERAYVHPLHCIDFGLLLIGPRAKASIGRPAYNVEGREQEKLVCGHLSQLFTESRLCASFMSQDQSGLACST